ncbi:ATP-binding protein [Nonomuraea zeae]|uniref:ATP-binding protein n=1 Tax=Nonomuraea zeae TaxID=1642303 RepID=UPI001478E69C|nr:ATP-binding protein [Nonomuraea zeae]
MLRCPISADLDRIRGMVRLHARSSGLRGHRLDDLVLAVNEAVTNVLDHGGAAGTVTTRGDAHAITVEVLDMAGALTPEHLAAPMPDPPGSCGYGLWIIQYLCDEVDVEQRDGRSRLTLRMRHHAEPSRGTRERE